MQTNPMATSSSRRQVLRGAAGATLALPFLPSLLPPLSPAAEAQVLAAKRKRNFIALGTDHGGLTPANMYPAATTLTTKYDIYPGHQVSHGSLTRTVQGTDAYVSPVLRGTSTALTDRIVSKMNVLRGFGHSYHVVHHQGVHLGNAAQAGSQDSDHSGVSGHPSITIDQLMAWSPSFYPDLSGVKERAMLWVWGNTQSRWSWNYSNPAAKTGSIIEARGHQYIGGLFDSVFVKPSGSAPPPPPMPTRKPIVDGVLEAYRNLRNGNRRLSSGDKQRLDDHMGRIAELQRKLAVVVTPPPSGQCGFGTRPTVEGNYKQVIRSWVDLVAAAIICGTSRIASVRLEEAYFGFSGDWHQEVAHQYNVPGKQDLLVQLNRQFFQDVVLTLANKLDVADGTGATYLDNTLLQWTQESGKDTHDGNCIPIVTVGGAAGFLNTGIYADYRNQVPAALAPFEMGVQGADYAGLTWNRWNAIALQAMGVPRSEFETSGVQGYGFSFLGRHYKTVYVPGVVQNASEVPRPLKV